MARYGSTIALLWLLVMLSPALSNAGTGCCICSGCPTPPASCAAMTLFTCEEECSLRRCASGMSGTSEMCATLPSCPVTPPSLITNPAPTASVVGLGLVAAALGGLGIRRLTRRRRG